MSEETSESQPTRLLPGEYVTAEDAPRKDNTGWIVAGIVVVIAMLSMLAIVLITACTTTPVQFQLAETQATEQPETIQVQVDNCAGYLPDIRAYPLPGGVGANNLVANGGEPFISIRKALVVKYGKSLRTIQLITPIRTHRVFAIAVTLTLYKGEVTGAVIDVNKIAPNQPVIYHYPLVTDASIESFEDIPCTSN